jgi:integrase/recombinase XerD
MNILQAIHLYRDYQTATLKPGTIKGYEYVLSLLEKLYANYEVEALTPTDMTSFMEYLTRHLSKSSKHLRVTQLKSFFNFIIEKAELLIKNPCDSPLLNKMYRNPKNETAKTVDKEKIDELIYRTKDPRNRLLLELQARCGLRVGEVLKIRPSDIEGRKITLQDPKSGRTVENAFMPEPVANRMQRYIAPEGDPGRCPHLQAELFRSKVYC